MKTGYIGSYSNLTGSFQDLINFLITANKSVLAAIETIEDNIDDVSENSSGDVSNVDNTRYDDLPF